MSGVVLLIMGIYVLAQGIVGALFGYYISFSHALQGIELTPGQLEQQISEHMIWVVIGGGLLALLFYWLFFVIKGLFTRQKESLTAYCRFTKTPATHVAAALVVGVLLHFIYSVFMYLTGLPERFPEHQELLMPLFDHPILLTLLGVGVIAALVEEIAFRGIIFNRLREDLPLVAALLLQAALFGLIHFNVLQSAYTFTLGIILGLAYYWTGSFWVPFAMHLSFNASSVIAVQALQLETAAVTAAFIAGGWFCLLLPFLILGGAIRGTVHLSRHSRREVY